MMQEFIDMMGREVLVQYPPQKIISVVPSQTELLYSLGLDEEVIGITKFCVHPEKWFRSKTRIGGTKKLNIDVIKALSPDLIIANKEENTQGQIEELAKDFPVWISDIKTVNDALEMMELVGKLVDKTEAALGISSRIRTSFSELRQSAIPRTVAYLIWYQPWMIAGGDTFIGDIIRKTGWLNIFEDRARYPEITWEELQNRAPDIVLLSSEPFPFKQMHLEEIKTFLPFSEIKLVDGEMFSWYGSRMEQAIPYFRSLIN